MVSRDDAQAGLGPRTWPKGRTDHPIPIAVWRNDSLILETHFEIQALNPVVHVEINF